MKKMETRKCVNGYIVKAVPGTSGHVLLQLIVESKFQWFHSQGSPWDEFTCTAASAEGNMEMLQFLYSQDCPWTSALCYVATDGGNIEIL